MTTTTTTTTTWPPSVVAIAIVPKFPSLLSFICSSSIVYRVLKDKKRRKMTYHRLVAGLSAADCLSSLAMFVGTWAIPTGSYAFGARGTQQTCEVQGFALTLGLNSSLLYNAMLGLYYVLQIKYKWPGYRMLKFEQMAHFIVCMVSIGIAFAGIPLELYNPLTMTCYIKEYPWGCLDTARNGYTTCDRGDNAWIYQLVWYFAPAAFSFLCQIVSLTVCYHAVLLLEKKNEQYEHNNIQHQSCSSAAARRPRRDRSKPILKQAVLYVCAFLMTWICSGIGEIIVMKTGIFPNNLIFIISILHPLQGFWNWLIFNKPSYDDYRKRHPHDSRWKSFCIVMGITHDPQQPHPGEVGEYSCSVRGSGSITSSYRTRRWSSLMDLAKRCGSSMAFYVNETTDNNNNNRQLQQEPQQTGSKAAESDESDENNSEELTQEETKTSGDSNKSLKSYVSKIPEEQEEEEEDNDEDTYSNGGNSVRDWGLGVGSLEETIL